MESVGKDGGRGVKNVDERAWDSVRELTIGFTTEEAVSTSKAGDFNRPLLIVSVCLWAKALRVINNGRRVAILFIGCG